MELQETTYTIQLPVHLLLSLWNGTVHFKKVYLVKQHNLFKKVLKTHMHLSFQRECIVRNSNYKQNKFLQLKQEQLARKSSPDNLIA